MSVTAIERAVSGDEQAEDVPAMMNDLGRRARAAARRLALAPPEQKNAALMAMAAALRADAASILAVNALDVADVKVSGALPSFVDRLTLDQKRIEAMAAGIEEIAALADPVGVVSARWERPNVTADAGALSLKAGNASILRGGSDSFRSSRAIHAALQRGLAEAGLPADAIQMVPTADRAAVGAMLSGLSGAIDVIVPRGGKSLVARVQDEARVPVFAHLEGIVHIYVHEKAELSMAIPLIVNAKMRRTGVCGAAETLLVDRAVAPAYLPAIAEALVAAGCTLRADAEARALLPGAEPASEADWSTEYLDSIIAVRIVNGLDEAIDHIERYGSHHTDCILTEDEAAAARFLAEVDSAIVMHNASTQFADGGEFGFGGEIGIATGRMHARGPVGTEQLTSFKYRVHGRGQMRP